MPPTRTTKPNLSSRFAPLGSPNGGGSAVNGHQDSVTIANPGTRPSIQPPRPPLLAQHRASSAHGSKTSFYTGPSGGSGPSRSKHTPTHTVPVPLIPAGGSTSQFHKSRHTVRPSRGENDVDESMQTAASTLLMLSNGQPPHQPIHVSQYHGNPVAPRVHEATTSFLTGASGFRMRDIHYYEASHLPVNRGGGTGHNLIDGTSKFIRILQVDGRIPTKSAGWSLLIEKTAPNALHNSHARFDAPKCDEDTRVEVTNELMEWIEDRYAPQQLLCMTGAAGSGKSCLQQTAAEKCTRKNILAASFFLSAEDPTRNTVDPVILTIAYQLGRGNSTLKWLIGTAIERDPLIFNQSLAAQTVALIVRPVEDLRDMGTDLMSLPYVILIDGLDEARGVDRQAELLTAIGQCLLVDNLPFRIFVASRPEWAIHSALQPGGHLRDMAYHIQLSDKYDATADMRRYLQRRFEEIGLRINNPKWFSKRDIETLVRAGSGQFIYVATVYKYISDRRASPVARMNVVLTWTPHPGQKAKPFEALDRLYSNVLLAAKDEYEAVDTHHGRDFLLLLRAQLINRTGFIFSTSTGLRRLDYPADNLSVLLNLEAQAEEALISDLRSLMVLEPGHKRTLRLYHKSFSDFLEEPSRAKDLFVPESRVYTHLAKCMMRCIIECPLEFDSLPAAWGDLPLSTRHWDSLNYCAVDLPMFLASHQTDIDDEIVSFTQNGGWQKINNLLPPLIRSDHVHRYFLDTNLVWVDAVQILFHNLKDRKPETAAVISTFLKKWKKDYGGNRFRFQ